MTDEELIARLRDDSGDWLTDAAADRIEALIEERDSLLAGHRALNIGGARLQDRAETAEAKLAKAVEALSDLMMHEPDHPDTIWEKARATLAEIKGESHDVN